MNISEILNNLPEGTKLYSTLFGDVSLLGVIYDESYPIKINVENESGLMETYSFDSEGRYFHYKGGECQLFPSKDNRDWKKFQMEHPQNFKPFDKVIVKDMLGMWFATFISHKCENGGYIACDGNKYTSVLPYEGNEHLIGR